MSTDALADSIVSALRERLPGWSGADDERFATLVRPRYAASQLAQQQLADSTLRALLASGNTDEIAGRLIEVGKATNLLFGPAFASGNLQLLHHPSTRAESAQAVVELLYGEGQVGARVQAFADRFPGTNPGANWRIATYFLWLVHPGAAPTLPGSPRRVGSRRKAACSPPRPAAPVDAFRQPRHLRSGRHAEAVPAAVHRWEGGTPRSRFAPSQPNALACSLPSGLSLTRTRDTGR